MWRINFASPASLSIWTTPIHANLAYHFQAALASRGLIPVTEKSKLAEEVECIEGIAPMKVEDYISFYLVDTTTDFLYQWFLRFCMKRPEDALWNLGNNFEGLEKEALTAFKKEVPNFLPIGPLQLRDVDAADTVSHGGVTPDATTATPTISLWPEDSRACMDWLSQHDTASVVYISFGSIVKMSNEELADIILGIEESGAPFLWAVRPDQGGAVLAELRKRLDTEAAARGGQPSPRALIVSWKPQVAVLMHPSVGLFISHCGWNSLMESLVGGVPILCKPGGFAEQRMNAQYVEKVWKAGLQLPASAACTPSLVKLQVCSLLGKSPLGTEVRERVKEIRRCAVGAASPHGGSSHSNFGLFVDDMRKRASYRP